MTGRERMSIPAPTVPGGPPPDSAVPEPPRSRPHPVAWIAGVYLLAAALVCGFAVLAFSGRGSPAPGATQGVRVCTATQRRSVTCPRSALFVPADYVKNGSVNDSYCVGFADQADTQAVLRADPADPNHLDNDGDGIACNHCDYPGVAFQTDQPVAGCDPSAGFYYIQDTGPKDLRPVPRKLPTTEGKQYHEQFPGPTLTPVLVLTPARVGAGGQQIQSFDPTRYLGQGNKFFCYEFASQADAQRVLRADSSDPNHLDSDSDGIACDHCNLKPMLRSQTNVNCDPATGLYYTYGSRPVDRRPVHRKPSTTEEKALPLAYVTASFRHPPTPTG